VALSVQITRSFRTSGSDAAERDESSTILPIALLVAAGGRAAGACVEFLYLAAR
jgi:hypothetical protein